jgi:CO dehydrogenase maturation factor
VACYHSKTGAVELYLNHLIDLPGEYAIVDSTAGAESFASGMFTRFDLTFLVAEPTRKSVQVVRQWTGYASSYDVPVAVIGNKVETGDDLLFLREHAGQHLIAHFGHLPAIRAMEQGRPFSLDDLGTDSLRTLAELRAAIDSRPKDWATFTRQAT